MTEPREPEDPGLEDALRRLLRREAPDSAPFDLGRRAYSRAVQGTQPRPGRVPFKTLVGRLWMARPLAATMAVLVLSVLVVGTLTTRVPAEPAASPISCPRPTDALSPGTDTSPAWSVGQLRLATEGGSTATLVAGCDVLFVGGTVYSAMGQGRQLAIATTQRWDAEQKVVTPAGRLAFGRTDHATTLMDDGRVLVVGGSFPEAGPDDPASVGAEPGPVLEAEVWDPGSGLFSSAGILPEPYPYLRPVAVRLGDGRVLVMGGGDGAHASVWDPVSGTFHATGSLRTTRGAGYTATLVADGRVFVIGGLRPDLYPMEGSSDHDYLASVEVWDPETGLFSARPPLPEPRAYHTTTLLPDGRIVVAGGASGQDAQGWPEIPVTTWILDLATDRWAPGAPLAVGRMRHGAGLMPDGTVLFIGGEGWTRGDQPRPDTAEIWDPHAATSKMAPPPAPRVGGHRTFLPDGTVLMSGGYSHETHAWIADLERYDPTP